MKRFMLWVAVWHMHLNSNFSTEVEILTRAPATKSLIFDLFDENP